MNIEAPFRAFLSNIEPSPNHVDQAKTGHETLRARLEGDDDYKARLEGGTFLSGSYRRQTAVKPIKDVDIIVPLEPSDLTPRECLEELRDVLKKYYKAPALEDQRRSIKVELSYITMDIVPAVARDGADGILEVPDREQHEWVKSHPKEHIAYTQGLNKSSAGAYVPLVKALKWWRTFRLPDAKHPKSFFLEVMVGRDLDLKPTSMGELVHDTLQAWRRRYADDVSAGRVPELDDPGVPGQKLRTGMTAEEFGAFYSEVQASEEVAALALAAESPTEQAEHWQKLFGPEFPSAESGRASTTSKTVMTGGRVSIRARLAKVKNGQLADDYPSTGGRPLPKGWWIRFAIESTNVAEPFEVRWLVENHGPEALADRSQGGLGHQTFPGGRTQWETTKYAGSHYMYCDIIKDGVQVARARHVVNIR